jgi:cell division septation protein DedD
MRTRVLRALLTAFVLHGAARAVAQVPQRSYVSRLYRSTIEREALVGHDARRLGMGSTGVAAGEYPGVAWNPAMLGSVEHPTLSLMDSGSSDTSGKRAGAASAGASLVDVGLDAPGAAGAGAWLGDWGDAADKERLFLAGYGVDVGRVAVGVAVRHERQYFAADTLSAWTADVGLRATGAMPRGHAWRAGLVASRLGQGLRDQRGLRAPRAFNPVGVRGGGEYALGAGPTLATELAYVSDTRREARDRVRWHAGIEQLFLDGRLAARAGYNSIANYDRISHGLASLGVSANVAGAGLDYAFVTGSDGLGETFDSRHYLSFRVAWAGVQSPLSSGTPDGGFTLPASATPASVSVREGAFSPNGDGIRDEFVLDVGANEPGASVVLTALNGARIRDIRVSDRMVASWDGRTEDGAQAADGLYRWDVVVGDRTARSGLALLDASPPVVHLTPSPVVFTAGADRPYGSVVVGVEEANAVAEWSLSATQDGSSIAVLYEGADMPESLGAANLAELQPGHAYEITLRVVDEAGSDAVGSARFTALDMRAHTAWVEDDIVYVDVPSTYFDAASADLSREGRDLAASAAGDAAVYIAVAGDGASLTVDRVAALRAALIAEGMPPAHVAVAAAPVGDQAPGSGLRLTISSRAAATGDAAEPRHSEPTDRTFRVLVGSFRDRENAAVAAANLSDASFDARVREVRLASGTWFRVVVGTFETRDDAEALQAQLQSHVPGDTVILTPAIP